MASIALYPINPLCGAWGVQSIHQQWHSGSDNPASSCKFNSDLASGNDTTLLEQSTWHVELDAYMLALRQAQAYVLAFAVHYERVLVLPKPLDLPGKEHGHESNEVEVQLANHVGGNATAATQPTCLDSPQAQTRIIRYGDHDLPDTDRTIHSRIDLTSVANVREVMGKKKKKNQASKANAWESDNEDTKDDGGGANEGNGGDVPGGGGGGSGAGGSGDGEKPGENGGGGDDGKDDEDWNYGNSKKTKKAKKKQAFSWAVLDEEDLKDTEDGDDAVTEPAAVTAPVEPEPEDDWAGYTTASRKKKKKGKALEPDPPLQSKSDELKVDESNAQALPTDSKESSETKSGAFDFTSGWGSGWGSSKSKWDFSGIDNAATTEDKPADTGFEGAWGSFGRKDKDKTNNSFTPSNDAAAGAVVSTSVPQQPKSEEEDPWAPFSTKTKKKKGEMIEETLPLPITELPPVTEDLPEPAAVEVEPEEEFSWGMSAKDKKKAKKAARKAGLSSALPEPEVVVVLESEPVPEIAEVTKEIPAPQEPLPEDDLWAGFPTKKKKKGKTTRAEANDSEPVPASIRIEEISPPDTEPDAQPGPAEIQPEAQDDLSWGMSAKDKKKAKRAARKGLVMQPEQKSEPEPEPEPQPDPQPAPPAHVVASDRVLDPEEPVDNFTWGMTAKERKKAKKAARNNATIDMISPSNETPAAEEQEIEEPVAINVETALVVVEKATEAEDWFAGWGSNEKKATSAESTAGAPLPEVEKEPESWTFGWGQSKKDKKKKGRSPSPEPEIAGVKEDVIMTPESIDEPKAELDDDAGWGVGTKKKKIGRKEIAIEVIEPSPEIPVQKPEEEVWGWTTGKKVKKGKKGSHLDPVHPPAPSPPSEPAVEEPEPAATPVPEEPLIGVDEPGKAPKDEVWTSTTKKSKKDKKGKREPEESQSLPVETLQDEIDVVTEDAPVEEDASPESVSREAEAQDVKNKKEEKKTTSNGWGFFGSSSKSTTRTKDSKEKDRKERKDTEAAAEKSEQVEQPVVDLAAEKPTTIELDTLAETIVSETKQPVKVKAAAGWGFWGTALKPTKQAKPSPESGANQTVSHNDDKKSKSVPVRDHIEASAKTKAKGSIAERIKALQETSGSEPKTSEKIGTDDTVSPAAEETQTKTEAFKVPKTEVQQIPADSLPAGKPATKAKGKGKLKSSKSDKIGSPEPVVPFLVEPIATPADVAIAPTPLPGEFPAEGPVEEVPMPEAREVQVAASSDKAPSKAKEASRSTSKTSSKKSADLKVEAAISQEVTDDKPKDVPVDPLPVDESSMPLIDEEDVAPIPVKKPGKRVSKATAKSSFRKSGSAKAEVSPVKDDTEDRPSDGHAISKTDHAEPRSSKKERPKVVRDHGGSSWGFWGSSSRPDSLKDDRRAKEHVLTGDQRPEKAPSSSKSAKTPPEVTRAEGADKKSEPSKSRREGRDRASNPRGSGFSGAFGMGSPALSRSKSARGTESGRKPSRVHGEKSMDAERGPAPQIADDIETTEVSPKAAKVMGMDNGRNPERRESTREKQKSRSSQPEPIVMSGALNKDPVSIDADGHPDEHEIVTGPDDLAFVRERPRPPLKRSATSARKTGLLGGFLGSRRQVPSSGARAYDSDDGVSRRKNQVRDYNEDETTERRRARRAERHAAKAAEAAGQETHRREKELARRIRDEEEAEARRQEAKRARRAARHQAEEQEARDTARRTMEREKEQQRMRAEEKARRERRDEHRSRREQDRVRSSRHDRDHRSHSDRSNQPTRGPDKTSSWVRSVSDDPPPPPPVEGTIIDPPVHAAGVSDGDAFEAETTARELRRKHRKERERNGEENSADERRRRRREERRLRDEDEIHEGADAERSGRIRAYDSLGYADVSRSNGRPAGGVSAGSAWLRKLAGFQ